MNHSSSATTRPLKPASVRQPPAGRNARNVPVSPADTTPPQPKLRGQSEHDRQQDREPVQPEALLEQIEEKEGGKHRELRNG
jgi:hypothetical protein